MKSIITLLALALCMGLYSCSSENKDRSAGDTDMMDTSMNDTIDTSGVADTAGVDTMYRNSPATSQ